MRKYKLAQLLPRGEVPLSTCAISASRDESLAVGRKANRRDGAIVSFQLAFQLPFLRTGIPAPFERDMGTAAERRGEHAADLPRDPRRTAPLPDPRDNLGDTDVDEIPPDDA